VQRNANFTSEMAFLLSPLTRHMIGKIN